MVLSFIVQYLFIYNNRVELYAVVDMNIKQIHGRYRVVIAEKDVTMPLAISKIKDKSRASKRNA